ncbi:outer membrane beta-barrel protein [Neolewinella persica]|uniref:outer membrane beta-barrel protein n=1 Tax=Neolewinella persica TaxID=70998 RepID=UPI000381F499|nr:outer membrane beta-barrel protein [Neolewinella persica]
MTRNFFFLLLGLLFVSTTATAQVEFGLKAGLATESLQGERFDFTESGRESLSLALSEGNYGFQFGALLRIPLSDRFDIQTELTLNSTSAEFRFDDPESQNSQVFRERYNDVNIPILASWKLAFLRLNAGPVGHLFVSSTSDLMDVDGRDRTFDSFNLGYTLGGAVDIGPITVDVRYDGNFSRYGEDFAVAGETFRVDQAPKRWVGSIAYRF